MVAAPGWTASELMVVNAARFLRDGDVAFVGVGLPNIACNLAFRTHAPNLQMVYEAGIVGARPKRLPLSIGDPTLVSGATSVCSMYDIFALYLNRGKIGVGFLGGAQIDRFGSINSTVIGDYRKPKVRLPGSGGSMEIAAWAGRYFVLSPHQKRRFPEKVDFATAAGTLGRDGRRAAAGLTGAGPRAVITDLGVLEPDASGELVLAALHPGVTVEEVRAETGWKLKVADELRKTEPPGGAELRILREELDPERIYLK